MLVFPNYAKNYASTIYKGLDSGLRGEKGEQGPAGFQGIEGRFNFLII